MHCLISDLFIGVNSDQSFPIPRDDHKKAILTTYLESPHTYENIIKTENPKPNTPENVNVKEKTDNTTTVTDVRLEL